jgi:hypothetical protein
VNSQLKSHRERGSLPGSDVGVGIDFHVTFDVVLGGHVGWVTTQRTGSIALLVDSDKVDSHVIGEIHVGPVYHLEIVGLGGQQILSERQVS